jgi:hypothetical protein
MDQGDPELAAEVVCAVARAVIAAEGDAETLRAVPLGSTVTRLVGMRDEPGVDRDFQKLIGLASAVQRAKGGDAEALEQLPDLMKGVREWFGLRH